MTAPTPFKRRSLALMLVGMALALALWNMPQFDFILYPLRLFVTFVHETGHGLAALLTGGQIGRLVVNADGSGLATTAGGARWLILPAGYLGAAVFGAGLFYLANRLPHTRALAVGLGTAMALIALLYTDFLSTAFIIGGLIGAGLILLGLRAHVDLTLIILNALAVVTALNAVFDLFSLVRSSGATLGRIRNDAAQFSAEFAPLIPAAVWALIWAVLAVVILGAAVYWSMIKQRRR